MPKKIKLICLLLNLFVCLYAKSQNNRLENIKKPIVVDSARTLHIVNFSNIKPFNIIPANHYFTSLGFFCRKELQLQKITKIPLHFRLGNLEYTDRMEGKRKAQPQP